MFAYARTSACRRLVQAHTLRLMFLKVVGNLRVAAEVVDVFKLTLGRLQLARKSSPAASRALSSRSFPFGQPILHQHIGINTAAVIAVIQFCRVHRDRVRRLC